MVRVKVLIALLISSLPVFSDPCVKIIEKFTPEYPGLQYRLSIQGRVGKNFSGEEMVSEPTTYGAVRLDIPILDNYEKLRIVRQRIQDKRNAQEILGEYLSLKEEVEEGKKILKWLEARVEQGLEKMEKLLTFRLELNKKKQVLKSLTALFKSAGVSTEELEECWRGGI